MIELHPQLSKDCFPFGEFELCSLLLLNDANFPWFILVPNRPEMTELHQLSIADQQQFMSESMFLSRALQGIFQPDKINIAALGNMVPQLHIHHIARYKSDCCWPAPVWGAATAAPYKGEQIQKIEQQLRDWFNQHTEILFHWYSDD